MNWITKRRFQFRMCISKKSSEYGEKKSVVTENIAGDHFATEAVVIFFLENVNGFSFTCSTGQKRYDVER